MIASKKAIASSNFKYRTQLYEMHWLFQNHDLYKAITDGTYTPRKGKQFTVNERGKVRTVTSDQIQDKAVNHAHCDNILMPALKPYLIYDNGASQKGKGVSFSRRRLEEHLHQYYREHGSNDGYILIIDITNYYGSIPHDKEKAMYNRYAGHYALTDKVIDASEGDVGADIGKLPSQCTGIAYLIPVDNYVKIVRGKKQYARHTDDSYVISESKEELWDILRGIEKIAGKLGLKLNRKKTHITKLSKPFTYLKIRYTLTDTGRVIRRINQKAVTRERRKLKAYRRQVSKGNLTEKDVEGFYKSWMGSNYKRMSSKQIQNMKGLYFQLFGSNPRWKKRRKHGKSQDRAERRNTDQCGAQRQQLHCRREGGEQPAHGYKREGCQDRRGGNSV